LQNRLHFASINASQTGKDMSQAARLQEETNKALVRRIYAEWWNANGDPTSVAEMVHPGFVGHLGNGESRTFKSLQRDVIEFQRALGGLREEIEDMIAEGDRVAVRYTMYATHTGVFQGRPPTGRPIKISGIEIFRIANGKIAEFWHFGEPIRLD
jgi:predicted ester cyclase